MTPEQREQLGQAVREVWVDRQMRKHPGRVFAPWDELEEYERETDRLIAEAVVAAQRIQEPTQ